jgi:uncharacterized protein YyaL (SSP411 family)
MDETTFSNDEIIALLNAYFIPVRVENAQRPDIDVRYNQNGWPTIAFITPEGDHLASVNYLPPGDFGDVLIRFHTFYRDRKAGIEDAVVRASQEASRKAKAGAPKGKIRASAVSEITSTLMELADGVHGGYGPDHKFPHPEANEFLLYRYEATGDSKYLEHVTLTLDKMREGRIHDEDGGGFFRYSSKVDWSEPHREKLLEDHAGLLGNCLHTFLITKRPVYGQMAEEIIDYLNTKLSDPSGVAFYGCQDYVRALPSRTESLQGVDKEDSEKVFSMVDDWIYTDANAQVISAYLLASLTLTRPDCRERALETLGFLWDHCRARDGGMCHYFDGAPHVPGLLVDQAHVGTAQLAAYGITGEAIYLERAKELGEFILGKFTNSDGGFYDTSAKGLAHLRFRLTRLVENGVTANFFLGLADSTKEERYGQAALWALSAFTGDFVPYGVHAAGYGWALAGHIFPLLAKRRSGRLRE